jgi:hypothetical protein
MPISSARALDLGNSEQSLVHAFSHPAIGPIREELPGFVEAFANQDCAHSRRSRDPQVRPSPDAGASSNHRRGPRDIVSGQTHRARFSKRYSSEASPNFLK